MTSTDDHAAPWGIEVLHLGVLGMAALGLLIGLVNRDVAWVKGGVSLILLLPPLRVATSMMDEARARRFDSAVMGLLVLGIILFSRRIS